MRVGAAVDCKGLGAIRRRQTEHYEVPEEGIAEMISPRRRALWERALARSQQELETQLRLIKVPTSLQDRRKLAAAEHARDRVVFDAFEQGRLTATDIAAALGTRVRDARSIIDKAGLPKRRVEDQA